jgi:hypothetical protein
VKGEWNGGTRSTHEGDEKCSVGEYTKEINFEVKHNNKMP